MVTAVSGVSQVKTLDMFFGWEKQAFHFGLLQFMHWNLGGSQWLGTMDHWASFVCSKATIWSPETWPSILRSPRWPIPTSSNAQCLQTFYLYLAMHYCTPKISVKVASAQHNWSLEDFVPSTTAFLPGNDVKDLQFKYVQFSSHKKTPLEVIQGQISYRGNKEKPLFWMSRMVQILVSWNCCHKSMQWHGGVKSFK